MPKAPVPVRVRDCACPDTPHAETGDVVYLRPTLSLEGGIAAQQDFKDAYPDVAALTRRWLVTFVRYGATGANFLPEPFDVTDVLDDFTIAEAVADAANDLYGEAVLRPLGLSRPATSPDGPTDGSTSPTPTSPPTSPA